LKRTYRYFDGVDVGEALGFAPLAGLAAGLVVAAGEAAGLAAAAGEAAGLAVGAVAGFEAGDGEGDAPSSTTECVPIPGSEKTSARNIKSIAATMVAFSSGF
jgi:hypothetical protein